MFLLFRFLSSCQRRLLLLAHFLVSRSGRRLSKICITFMLLRSLFLRRALFFLMMMLFLSAALLGRLEVFMWLRRRGLNIVMLFGWLAVVTRLKLGVVAELSMVQADRAAQGEKSYNNGC